MRHETLTTFQKTLIGLGVGALTLFGLNKAGIIHLGSDNDRLPPPHELAQPDLTRHVSPCGF